MELKDLAKSIGVAAYPDELEQAYKTLDESDELICDVDFIKAQNEKYDLLGDYLDEVIAGAVELREKKELLTWARLAYAYCSKASLADVKKMTFPTPDGSIIILSGENCKYTFSSASAKSPTREQQIQPEFISVISMPASFIKPPSMPISPNSFSIKTTFSPAYAS